MNSLKYSTKVSERYRLLPRIWTPTISEYITLDAAQKNYLVSVLRLRHGGEVRIFNDSLGEYLCFLEGDRLRVGDHIRPPKVLRPLHIAPCLIKPKKFTTVLDISTQLGCTVVQPLIASHSQVRIINESKYQKCLTEATEQSERFSIPELRPPITIEEFLKQNGEKFVIYANEREEHNLMQDVLVKDLENSILVVGPEGGFSLEELELFSTHKNTFSISLGKNILRTETAVAVILGQFLMK